MPNAFTRTTLNGQPAWLHIPTGRTFPVVSGGAGDPGADTGASDGGSPPATGQGDKGGASPVSDGFKPITSQEDLEAVLKDRLERERRKFADYDELKAKAKQLDELQDANKSELEKIAEKAAAAEERARALEVENLRWRVAAKHGISDEDAELFLTGTDEETLTKQAQRLAERVSDRKKNGNVVSKEGTAAQAKEDPLREFARELFQKADH